MKKLTLVIFVTLCFLTCMQVTAQTKKKLVWSDEFNYTGLPDSTRWNYDVGGHGWGNHELQYYTNKKKTFQLHKLQLHKLKKVKIEERV